MQAQTETRESSEKELFITMAISAWDIQNERVNKLLSKLSEEQWQKEIAPGKNTGIYLFGHLIAVNDGLFPLFGLGEKKYPELGNIFLTLPDKSGQQFPSLNDLKKFWSEVNSKLTEHFKKMKPEDWFAKHSSVSAEDFAKEPHRNKLNVLLNRTSHQSYHLGQIMLLQ